MQFPILLYFSYAVQTQGDILKSESEIPEPDEVPETPKEYPPNPEPLEPTYPPTPEPEPSDAPEPDLD
jgi:hypothetical protein